MTSSSTAHSPLVFAFGILGNIVSCIVFLAPVPTFIRVFKKKSTEGFSSVPYVFALFSATIWIYYAFLKSDEMLLITINGFGCVIETIYIAMYITYAPKQARTFTLRLLLLVNFGGFCSILLLSHFLAQGPSRVKVLGWVCVAFSVSVFAAPLSIMRMVIRTKSVEFMPFSLSFFLTLSAIMWLFYGLLLKDLYVAAPNVLGFSFGVVQMILYAIYRNNKTVILDGEKIPEHKTADDVVKQMATVKLLLLLNVCGYGLMLTTTLYFAKGEKRLKVVGSICLVFNLTVFAAPLCILKKVIRTKSVEFMPFTLSFFLKLGVVVWFYGFLLKDYNIVFPNILGFLFGIAQMVLYVVYKNAKNVLLEEPIKVQELSDHIIDVMKINTVVCPELIPVVLHQPNNVDLIEIVLDPTNIVVKEIKTEETKEDIEDAPIIKL